METPKSAAQQIKSMRNHTPRLSERKKKLFDDKQDDDDEVLKGIQPLAKFKTSGHKTPKSTKTIEALMGGSSGSCKKTPRVISFFETESDEADHNDSVGGEHKPSPSRRSVRLSIKKSSPTGSISGSDLSTSPQKENIPLKKTPTRKQQQEDKQLQKMFSNSMQITPREKTVVIDETSSEEEMENKKNESRKIHKRHNIIEGSTGLSPMRKVAKMSLSPLDSVSISTKSFYSGSNTSPSNATRATCRNLFGTTANTTHTNNSSHSKVRHGRRSEPTLFNRGIRNKFKKRPSVNNAPRHHAPVDIDRILKNVRNEKLKNLITSNREKKQQIEKVHSILRKACNPITMAKPLSTLNTQDDSNNNVIPTTLDQVKTTNGRCYDNFSSRSARNTVDTEFSDIECDSVEEEEDEGADIEIDADFENALRAMDQEVVPLIKYDRMDDALSTKSDDAISVASSKKKFFKSGRQTNTKKEVTLTGNIKATVAANGKLSLKQEKKKVTKRLKIRSSVTSAFSDEQATVEEILRNLDDTAFGDIIIPNDQESNDAGPDNAEEFLDEIDIQLALMKDSDSPPPPPSAMENGEDISQIDTKPDYTEFLKRVPYKTNDPEMIERQNLLLDFLITNNICTEENFNIFIADPDNHKEEAERIIDDLVMVVTGQQQDFRHRIPYNTRDPQVIQQQMTFLDFLEENHLCTEENFDIFIANYDRRKAEADEILAHYIAAEPLKTEVVEDLANGIVYVPAETNTNPSTSLAAAPANPPSTEEPKLFPIFYPGGRCQPLLRPASKRKQPRCWNAGYGSDQLQIDAGQKAFGAIQCKQCGLVYTAHEPEEEKVHRDFHASLHVLRFKGWIDEDIMAIFPEWGQDGRIIRLTESSALKRKERLMEILKIVDKELGFASYIVPKTFVAYFAVRKMQIVGLCLVQPLEKASKYLNINGVDCCTEEQFEAKCGISRIWVSPLHRRFHIATKLIQAVQLNTIYGEEIPLDKIAFSAPTEMGKAFAQKITNTENFLVYQ